MKISELTEPNVLSLWLGNIGDFDDLDEYVWEHFEKDFDLEFEEHTAPEIDAQEQPKPVKELIDGFSFSDQWIENAMSVCGKAGWSEAKSVVILFNVRYPEALAKNASSSPIQFVGNIEWEAK